MGVRPVFYGMLLFNKALGSSAQMLKSSLSGSTQGIKVGGGGARGGVGEGQGSCVQGRCSWGQGRGSWGRVRGGYTRAVLLPLRARLCGATRTEALRAVATSKRLDACDAHPRALTFPPPHPQVWPLWNEKDKALRVVVINKRPDAAVNVTLAVNKPSGFGFATITRMVAPGQNPLEARTGVTVGGQYFNEAAVLSGAPSAERILRSGYEGKLAWRVYMPPASAALVVIPKATY